MELKTECQNILKRLDRLEYQGIIGLFDKCTIIEQGKNQGIHETESFSIQENNYKTSRRTMNYYIAFLLFIFCL